MSTPGKGREFLLKYESSPTVWTTLAGIQANTVTIANESVDVTDMDSNGWRELLSGAGTRTVSISSNGIAEDATTRDALEDAALADTFENYRLLRTNGDYYEGTFQIPSFEMTGEHNNALTFSMTLESSGQVTLTRA